MFRHEWLFVLAFTNCLDLSVQALLTSYDQKKRNDRLVLKHRAIHWLSGLEPDCQSVFVLNCYWDFKIWVLLLEKLSKCTFVGSFDGRIQHPVKYELSWFYRRSRNMR